MSKNPALKAGACALAAAALGFGVAACGGSTAAGVQTAPDDGLTQASVTATTTTTAVTTPTSGALATKPVVAKPSGSAPTTLVKKILTQGSGTAIADGDDITVNYYGVLYATGKPFGGGSTWTSNTKATPYGPIQIGAGEVIKGWDKGLVGVKAGSRVELIIPPSLAYGDASQNGIPKDSTLIFVIDVLKVAPGSSSSTATSSSGG